MDYKGVIIEESLGDKSVLSGMKILGTKTERVTPKHATPWLAQWHLHTIGIPEAEAEKAARKIAEALEAAHPWYADFKNDARHYIVFRNKVFFIDRRSKAQYDEAKAYGIRLGIPPYQVDFHPDVAEWKR